MKYLLKLKLQTTPIFAFLSKVRELAVPLRLHGLTKKITTFN